MISFPKKSFYFKSEVLSLLNINDKELKAFCREGLQSLFSDNGKKVFLREDIISLYAQGIVVEDRPIEPIVNIEESEQLDFSYISQLTGYRDSIQEALSLISQIKSSHPQIWCNS